MSRNTPTICHSTGEPGTPSPNPNLEPILPRGFNLSTPEAPERVRARQTSTNGHRMWGEAVWLGRDFAPDEDQPGWRRMKCGTSGRSNGSSSSAGIFGSPFAARSALPDSRLQSSPRWPWASGQTQPSSASFTLRCLGRCRIRSPTNSCLSGHKCAEIETHLPHFAASSTSRTARPTLSWLVHDKGNT